MSTAELPVAADTTEDLATCPFCGAPQRAGHSFCSTCGQPGTPHEVGFLLRGAYRVAALLSTSSTGAVYAARDERRKRDVVLKELLAPAGSSAEQRAALASRFAHELKTIDHLRHQCLPEVLAGFDEGGRHYLVCALIPGKDMQAALADRAQGYSEREVRPWMNQLVNLLEYMEERHPPFVHGEILPSHLMLKADGTPCLIGFGLAPRLGLRPYLELPGQKVPEAAPTGKKRSGKSGSLDAVGAGNDIYGLGASLHALLTGRDVFAGADDVERPFPNVRDLAPRVSVGIAEMVNRAVASESQRRYPSAVAMQATLAPLLGVSRPLPAALPPGESDGTLGRWAWWLGAALVAAVIAVAAYLALHKTSGTAVTPTATPAPAPTSPLKPGLPPPAHTLPVADAFIRASSIWPETHAIFRRGAALWVDNTAGGAPIKAVRINYSTGKDGFTLRATLRLESGPPTAAYGLVAADRPLSPWENVALLIRGDGEWSVVRNHAGHATTLVPWRQALQLRLGHNSPNELQLALLPGTGKGHGTFVVTINGQRMSALIPAWSAAPTGRVGIMAAPGARVVCDAISVDPLSAATPTVEDHFLDNRLAWSPGASGAVTPLLRNSVLQLQAGARRPWAEASTSAYGALAHQASFNEEAVLGWGNGNGSAAAAGLVFARITPPKPKPRSKTHAVPVALAALIDVTGHVQVVELAAKRVVMVLRPVFSPRVRVGYGLNVLDVTVTRKAELLQVRITVNGGAPIAFATGKQGLVLGTGIATTGASTSVKAVAFKLFL